MANPVRLYAHEDGWMRSTHDGAAEFDGDPRAFDWAEAGRGLRSEYGRSRVRVMLSARVARFCNVPWQDRLPGPSAWQAHCRDWTCSQLGVGPETIDCRFAWPTFGRPVGVIAYPRKLLADMEAGLASHGHRLERVSASTVQVLDRWQGVAGGSAAHIVFDDADGPIGIAVRSGELGAVDCLEASAGQLNAPSLWLARRRVNSPAAGDALWWSRAPQPSLAGVSERHTPHRPGMAAATAWLELAP